jgi:hypothetical protein
VKLLNFKQMYIPWWWWSWRRWNEKKLNEN